MITIDFLRQFRVGSFAIFDFTTAFLGMLILSPFLSWIFKKVGLIIPKKNWLFLTLPIGIFIHLLIGRKTPMTVDFLDLGDHYILKVIIIILLILGFTGIKKIKK
jgi:hypothetical protein